MEQDQVKLLQNWEKVLTNFLVPGEMIEALPKLFQVGSQAYEQVRREDTQSAVQIIIEKVKISDMTFGELTAAISQTRHKWLAAIMNGSIEDSKVEDVVLSYENATHMRQFLTIIAPHLREIIHPVDVAFRLKDYSIIQTCDLQEITRSVDRHGDEEGVRTLLTILVRQPPGWWSHFVKILKELNYSADLIKMLDYVPDNSTSSAKAFCQPSSDIAIDNGFSYTENNANLEVTSKAAAFGGENSKMCPYQTVDSGTKAVKYEQRIKVKNYQESLAAKASSGKNVIIYAPKESGIPEITSLIVSNRFHARLQPKIVFVVPKSDLACQYDVQMKALLPPNKWKIDRVVGGRKSKSFKNSIADSNIVIVTHQLFCDALEVESQYFLFVFDLIIFAECQQARKKHNYNVIMSHYQKLKLQNSKSPQIIGFADEPGPNKSQKDFLNLCAILDASGGIVTIPKQYRCQLSCEWSQTEYNIIEEIQCMVEKDIDNYLNMLNMMRETPDIIPCAINNEPVLSEATAKKSIPLGANTTIESICISSNKFKVICSVCKVFICNGHDIEVLIGTIFTCVTRSFKDKYVEQQMKDGGTEKKFEYFCKSCKIKNYNTKLGSSTKHKQINIPLLKAGALHFIHIDQSVNKVVSGNQWKKITNEISFKNVEYDELVKKVLLT